MTSVGAAQIEERIAALVESRNELLAALRVMVGRYVDLANSGDCGQWDPETEPQVQMAREAIKNAERR